MNRGYTFAAEGKVCALHAPVLDVVDVSSTTRADSSILAYGGMGSCRSTLKRVIVVRDIERSEAVVRCVGNTGLGTADAASAEVEVVAVQTLVSDRRDTDGAASAIGWGMV